MHPDEKLARLAAMQYGVVTREQALASGLTPDAVVHRVRTGRLRRLRHGTYAVAGSPMTWEQRVLASTLAMRGVASHTTAAVLWGLLEGRPELHVTVSHATGNGRSRNAVVHRAKSLGSKDVRRVGPIAVTCPARTLVDVASTIATRQLEAAVDRALTRGLTSLADLDRYIRDRRLGHRPGVGRLRALLADRTEGVPSEELEREFVRLIRRARLPKPLRQTVHGRFRIDFTYTNGMVAIEVDGWSSHGTPAALAADLKRQNELVLGDWTVLRFTWKQLIETPNEVVATIRRALRGVQSRA